MALAWALIKSGDRAGTAPASIGRAEAASALEMEPRCHARVRIAQSTGRPATSSGASPYWHRPALMPNGLGNAGGPGC